MEHMLQDKGKLEFFFFFLWMEETQRHFHAYFNSNSPSLGLWNQMLSSRLLLSLLSLFHFNNISVLYDFFVLIVENWKSEIWNSNSEVKTSSFGPTYILRLLFCKWVLWRWCQNGYVRATVDWATITFDEKLNYKPMIWLEKDRVGEKIWLARWI